MLYLIGLGSNILPEKHLFEAIQSLKSRLDILSLSPVLVNPPCGYSFKYVFHNQLLLAHTLLLKKPLKAIFEQIELELGREAKTPARKLKDRTIDIDIVSQSTTISALITIPLEDHYNRQILSSWTEINHLMEPSTKEG